MRSGLDLSVYVITDAHLRPDRSHLDVAMAAVEGGATVIQFREKDAPTREMYRTAIKLKEFLSPYGIPLIVNDRIDIALAVDADGVHLGQEDMPVDVARRIMGPGKIIGASATNLEEAVEAERSGADYIGFGPIFPTGTKPDASPPTGLAPLRDVCKRVGIPVVAIGGITASNASLCLEAGAAGVAVISAVLMAPDMVEATRAIRKAVTDSLKRVSP
jgi:thiamine-phosphate pyrophosphorylase